ncbi:MAG: coiled-coil domain-containing protein [Nitrospirota bacterium]
MRLSDIFRVIILLSVVYSALLNGCLLFKQNNDHHESEKISIFKKGLTNIKNKNFEGAASNFSIIDSKYPEDLLAEISRTFIDMTEERELHLEELSRRYIEQSELKAELSEVQKELSDIREDVISIKEKKDKIQKENHRIRKENIQLKKEINDLKNRIKKLTKIEKDMKPEID